ncbi:tuzin [Perkinsela sp. CCAP 1560/4]|nr:tuzin [Perkinsela sp. CCAP 1560/4]|eukprot:KNH09544.1 tuzin [Perkinsela sp. CCAP 1560/4]
MISIARKLLKSIIAQDGVPVSLLTKYARVSAFVDGSQVLGFGRVIGSLSDIDLQDKESKKMNLFCVEFDSVNVGPHVPLEIATSVWVQSADRASTGIIAKVRNDGTYSVLMDNGNFETVVARDRIVASEGKSPLLNTDRCKNLAEWIVEAGVERRSDAELAALVLCKSGWRREKMYLLREEDVSALQHLKRSTRASILELAEWEMERKRIHRDEEREREKERVSWSYVIVKYAGVVSATFASFGVCSLFFWNYLNYRRSRRHYQMRIAVNNLTNSAPHDLDKGSMECGASTKDRSASIFSTLPDIEIIRRIIIPLNPQDSKSSSIENTRSVVIIGSRGCGKSTIVRHALDNVPGVVYVAVRTGWSHEDLTKAVVRGFGVDNLEACGDLTTFTRETLREVASRNGTTPIIVYSLRIGDNFDENRHLVNVVLNQQRHISHDLKMASTISEIDHTRVHVYPGLYHDMGLHWVRDFSTANAKLFLQGRLSETATDYIISNLGTNVGTLDQTFSDMLWTDENAEIYIARKFIEAEMFLDAHERRFPELRSMIDDMANSDYLEGVPLQQYPHLIDGGEVPNVIFHVNWVNRAVLFNNKILHQAAERRLRKLEAPVLEEPIPQ